MAAPSLDKKATAEILAMAMALMPEMQKAYNPGGGLGFNYSTSYKHTTPTGTPSTPYLTGPGGLFGVGGVSRDVISTRMSPRGLASILPVKKTVDMNPLFPYITGFQNVSGSNPNGVCDDGQIAGAIKACLQTAQFGRYTFRTRELEVNRIGQRTNRGEFLDLRLVNDPLVSEMGGLFPNLPAQSQILAGQEMLARMLEVGVAFQNKLTKQLWTGNPANNSAGKGYMEFPGLEILIGTTKVDALTQIDCPSLDSLVLNFNYGLVDASGLSPDIVHVMTSVYRDRNRIAEGTNMNPVEFAWVMRHDAFYEIASVWPCSYLTYRCQFRAQDGTQVNNVNASDQVAMRDAMIAGRYLLIDGKQVPVIIDDGIEEEDEGDVAAINGGEFASDIYLIPLTVVGGMAATYWEVFDFENGALQAAQQAGYATEFWTDDGRFFWVRKPVLNWCVQLMAKIEPRVILHTPQLAARINNVKYRPLIHSRDSLPTDNYFVNGGVTTARAAPSFFADWNS